MSLEIEDLVKKGIVQGLGFYILLAIIYVMKFPKWIAYLLLVLGILYLLYILFVIWFLDKTIQTLAESNSVKIRVVPKKVYASILFMIVLNIGLIYAFSKRGDSDKSSKSSKKSK
jgi:hypothetical protein